MALLAALIIAFQIWMFVDAFRRRASWIWYLLILFPVGALIYLVFKKLDAAGLLTVAPYRRTAADPVAYIERLSMKAEESPSFANRLRLARALFDARRYEDAGAMYRKALQTHPDDREALYGLGLSQLESGACGFAVETLLRLVDLKFDYRDYGAARSLVRALWRDERREEALRLLEEITERNPQLRHKVTLAHYLIEAGLKEEALRVLDDALARFERASDFIRAREGRWATEANGLRRNLTS
jgi:hypothetical protein